MNSRQGSLLLASMAVVWSAFFLSGCASGRKQKLEQREKLAASSGLYCDFVNGDKNKEVELELNMLMSKKCDSDRPFSITNYKTPAEVTGVLYCCAIKKNDLKTAEVVKTEKVQPTPPLKPEVKTEPKVDSKAEVKPAMTTPPSSTSPKAQSPVDKKASQPQDSKSTDRSDLDEDVGL